MSLKKIAQQLESQKITTDKMLEKVGTIDMGIYILSGRARDSAVRSIFSNNLIQSIEKSNRGILKAIRGFQEGKKTGDDLEENRERKDFNNRLLKAIEGIQGGGKVSNKTVDKSKTVNKSGGFGTGIGAGVGAGLGFAIKGLGAVATLGALGFGIGAFFTGLSAGDKLGAMINTDMSTIKKQMVTLGEAFADTPTEGLLKMGALLAAGGAFGALFGAKSSGKAMVGMGAIGLGFGAFFAGLALGDKAGSWMNTDMSSLKNMMINLAEGLGAFSGQSLVALGALLGAGALFGAVGGAGAAGMAAVGMGAIGVGLGAFFAGLAATDGLIKILGFFGADGTGIRDLMINLAAGLNPLSELDGANLIAVGSSMVTLGGGLIALLGGQALGGILDFVGRIFGKNDEEDVFQKIYRGLLPLSTLNADNLQGLSDIGEKIDIVTNSVERFGKVNFNKIDRSVARLGKSMSYLIPMMGAMIGKGPNPENRYLVGEGWFDGQKELDFTPGLNSFSGKDIENFSKVSSLLKPVPTQAPKMKESVDTASQIAANKTGGNAVFAPSNNSTNNTNNNSTSFVSNGLSSHDSMDPFMGTRTA